MMGAAGRLGLSRPRKTRYRTDMENNLTIRPPEPKDRADWGVLYAAYAEFYKVDQSDEMRDRVWSWLMDPAHEVEGRMALLEGAPVGLAHFRHFTRPLMAATGGFLDDLFVTPDARGSGAAEALIRAVEEEGRARGWGLIRWITAEDNARARTLYDRVATHTIWATYDLKIEERDN